MSTFRQYTVDFVAFLALAPASAYAQPLEPYEVMHALSGDEGPFPMSGLIRGADDRLYGTAAVGGGADGAGTIYRIEGGVFDAAPVHTFSTANPIGGLSPVGLMRGRDKHLYGTTLLGGVAGDGVIYRLNWDSVNLEYAGVEVLRSFDCVDEGGYPWGPPVEGPDGALYGITIPNDHDLGCTEWSRVYKINKDGSGFQILASFNYLEVGGYQFGSLVVGSDLSVYGTLLGGSSGAYQYGSIFRVSPQKVVSFLCIFGTECGVGGGRRLATGLRPNSGLIRGIDNALYGTTNEGGQFGVGTIFRITEDGSEFSTLYSFRADSIHTPASPLVAGGDGKLYGIAHAGGSPLTCENGTGCGGSYVFDLPTSTFTLHQAFDLPITGGYAVGPLAVGVDRYLYGTQSEGGTGGQGVIFGLGDKPGLSMKVANRLPFPVVLVSTVAVSPGLATIKLDAQGSWDPDFDELTYSWDLDGATPGPPSPDHPRDVTATFPEGEWSVTLTVSDQANPPNPQSVTIQVVVIDAPPSFTPDPMPDISVPATSAAGAVVTYDAPTATDVADNASGRPDPVVSCSPESGSQFALGETLVTCSATDSRGTIASTSFVVTVTGEVQMTVPVDFTGENAVEATGPLGAEVNFEVSATSASGAPLGVECYVGLGRIQSGALFEIDQTTTVTCKSDVDPVAGLFGTKSFLVTVQDTTGPKITGTSGVPLNSIEFAAQGTFGAVIDYSNSSQGVGPEDIPAAKDLVDNRPLTLGTPEFSCTPAPGSTFPLGDAHKTLVTCTAKDSRGNPTVVTFEVIVRDDRGPVLTVPAIVAEATGPDGRAVTFTPIADDVTTPGGEVIECDFPSGATFPLGATTVTCTATDASIYHHESVASFLITIIDTTPPTIDVPDNITIRSTSPAGEVVFYTPTASDLVSGVVPVSCAPASGSTFPVGTTAVVCTASDLHSPPNTATATFDVIVIDGVPPVVTVPLNIVAEATETGGARVVFTASAEDNRDGPRDVTCVPASGSLFPLFPIVTTVTCSATDKDGNLGSSTFTVTVQDTTAPVVSTVAPIVAEATSPLGAVVTFATPTATDAVGVFGLVTCTPPSGSIFPLGVSTVDCTARDKTGNIGSASFTVTVRDTTRPVITMPANISLQATSSAGAVAVFAPTVVEAVGLLSLVCTPPSGSTFPIGTTQVVCVATDGSKNSNSGTLQVTVVDMAPVITVPADMTVVAAGPSGTNVIFVTSASDAIDGVRPVTCIPPSGSLFSVGTTTVNCSSSDSRGNASTATFTVTVVNKPPTLVVTLSPGVLWPPNHKMVTIKATIVTTSEAGPVLVTLVSIKSSEPDNGLGDGDTPNDIQGAAYTTDDRAFQLRAERSGKGPGRVYTVTYKATLQQNPSIFTTVTATVTVPHSMNGKTK